MSNFEWYTDENGDWEARPSILPPEQPGRQRWLYAPSTTDFRGDWVTADGRFLTLIYPPRDQAIAQQLLADFDHYLASYCGWPDNPCPADHKLLVWFSINNQDLTGQRDLSGLHHHL